MAIQEMICGLLNLGPTCHSMGMDQLLIEYLLVPSVILIIFLYFAVGFVLKDIDLKIKGLVAIVMYVVVVYSGLYAVFAPFAYSYLFLMIILLMAGFFISRLINWSWVRSGMGSAGKMYKELKEKKASEAPNEDDIYDLALKCTYTTKRIDELKKEEETARKTRDFSTQSTKEKEIREAREELDGNRLLLSRAYRKFEKAGNKITNSSLDDMLKKLKIK